MPADGRPVRVLMVSPSAFPGGAEDIYFHLVTRGAEAGVEPVPVLLADGPLADRLRDAGTPFESVPAGRLRQPGAYASTVARLSAMAGRLGVDACYANMPKGHLYAGPAALARRVPALWTQMNIPDPPGWIDRVASRVPARAVLALSGQAAAAQRRLSGSTPVVVLHPGTDTDRFSPAVPRDLRGRLGAGDGDVLIGIVGRLEQWKGQDVFLRAARLVADRVPRARFAVVGGAVIGCEGDYPDRLHRLASTLGLADRVVFTGHVTDVPGVMAALDVVVNASAAEPFGLVVTEAMATERAVVAVRAGGPAEAIEHGQSGLLVEAAEPQLLADALLTLARFPALRSRLGRAARARVVERFSVKRMVSAFADACWEAADRG